MNQQGNIVNQNGKFENRVSLSQFAAFGSGGIIPIALFNIAGILVGLMGNISLGLSAFWLGVILIIPRLWDAVSDPIIGYMSDNSRTRWGRRRPFILVGGILVAVFFVLIWWIPKGDMVRVWFPSEEGFKAFQLGYILVMLLLFFTACTIFEIPHGALGMEMTTDTHERTRLFSAKSFVGNLFAMSTPWLFALANLEILRGPGGNEADGMRYVSLLIAAIVIPLSFWWFFSLREPGFTRVTKQEKTPFWKNMKQAARNKNFIMLTLTIFTLAMGFNFVNLLGSYIPIFYVFGGDKVAGAHLLGINGTIWAVTGLLAVFPLNWISPKMGKRNTLVIAILLMCLAQLSKIVCYNPEYPYLIVIPTMLLSAGMLFFFTLGASMVGDICDEDELKTGVRTEGSFYSIFWWFIKMGTALASFVAGALIVFTMFDEGQVTKVDDIQGSIGEMRSKVQPWLGDSIFNNMDNGLYEKINSQYTESLEESKEYLTYLERESQKAENQTSSETRDQKKQIIAKAILSTNSAFNGLGQLGDRLKNMDGQTETQVKTIAEKLIALTLRIKLEKAKVNVFELMAHLKAKSGEIENSKYHYDGLMQNIRGLNDQLTKMNTSESLEVFGKELDAMESQIVPLRKQAPYTLFMMRVVEIGVPLLLSIFSIIFVLRYTLTEERSHEIKELLRQRNLGRS